MHCWNFSLIQWFKIWWIISSGISDPQLYTVSKGYEYQLLVKLIDSFLLFSRQLVICFIKLSVCYLLVGRLYSLLQGGSHEATQVTESFSEIRTSYMLWCSNSFSICHNNQITWLGISWQFWSINLIHQVSIWNAC